MSRAAGNGPDNARATLAWLGHPVTVLALIVLVVNDHLLKGAFPGVLTGKLSDVAGLVLAPPLIAVLATLLVARLPARLAVAGGLGLVAAGFALVKSSGYAAGAASAAWSAVSGPSLIRADRTDLLTLPALAVAWWSWTRARREPVRRRSARLVRLLVLLPAAVLAVAATSPVPYPEAERASAVDGWLVARVGPPHAAGDPSWYVRVSDDAGASWRGPGRMPQAPPEPSTEPVRRACSTATPGRCYRLVEGRIGVERSDDGGRTWRPDWVLTDDQHHLLSRQYPASSRELMSRELAVLDTADGRHAVLVANGRDGFAVRRPDGTWQRIGFAGAAVDHHPYDGGPAPLDRSVPSARGLDVFLVVELVLGLGLLVLALAGARAGTRRGYGATIPVGLAILTAGGAALLVLTWRASDGLVASSLLVFLLPVAAATVLCAVVPNATAGTPARWTVEVLLAVLLGMVLGALPLAGWLYGRPVRAWTAVSLALLATAPALALAWRAARLVGPRPPLVDPPDPRTVGSVDPPASGG